MKKQVVAYRQTQGGAGDSIDRFRSEVALSLDQIMAAVEEDTMQTATWNGERYELPYDDGVHMLQTYISNDGDSWELIGYDGVLRYIEDDEFFDNSDIALVGGPRDGQMVAK